MAPPRFQAGVTIVIYGNDPSLVPKTQALLDRLKALKVNSVSLAFPLYQDGWNASSVRTDPISTPTTDYMNTFAREAHQRGMAVMLRPLLDEQTLHPSHWRGDIQPSDRAAWFRSYGTLLVSYARVAAAARIEVMDIGTEFGSLQADSKPWLGIIASTRAVYKGQLTYSANWDTGYPAFGTALDFIGVDAFFPLSAPKGASVNQLITAWGAWTAHLEEISRVAGKPIVLTELGTTAEVASYQTPYRWEHGSGFSAEDQRRYYAASCQALKPMMAGMYWWALDFYPRGGPLATSTDYNPMDKPAEQEIQHCFQ
jgi:hypothetical protein